MKITTDRNKEVDDFVKLHMRLHFESINSQALHAEMAAVDLLPVEHIKDDNNWDYVPWSHLDLCKYLAIYWSCTPRLWKGGNKPSAFDSFQLRQLKLIGDNHE